MAILNKQTNRDRKVIPCRNNSDLSTKNIKIAVNIIAQGCTLFFFQILLFFWHQRKVLLIYLLLPTFVGSLPPCLFRQFQTSFEQSSTQADARRQTPDANVLCIVRSSFFFLLCRTVLNMLFPENLTIFFCLIINVQSKPLISSVLHSFSGV